MHLAERDAQLSTMDALAATARAGRGQVALIGGPPATGRTALLQAATERLQPHLLVLHAACAPAEQTLPGGVLSQLWHSAAVPAGLLDRVTALLGRVADRAPGAADAAADPELLRLLHTLCLHLRELAADQPVLIAVDDVRHADQVSLTFLQQLVRRLRTYRVLLVLTDQTEPDAPLAPLLAELQRHGHVHQLTVGPLSAHGVEELVRPHVAPDRLAAQTTAVHTASGGNPLLVNALIADLTTPTAGAYGKAFAGCLHTGDELPRRVVQALAVLGEDAHRVPPERLLDLPADAVRPALNALHAAGLLLEGGFRHRDARPAVLAAMPHDQRAELHARAATLLQEAAAPAHQVVGHLLQSGRPASLAAVPLLIEVAEQAPAGDGSGLASRCLELALQAHTHPRARAAVRARLCHTEWDANPAAALRHLGPLLSELTAGHLSRNEGILLARRLLRHGRADESARALELLRASGDAPAELRDLESWLAYTHPTVARRRPAPPADDTAALLTPSADPWLHACAGMAEALLRGQHSDGAERALRVLGDLHLGRHTGWADEALLIAITALLRADRSDAAATWCARLADDAHTRAATWRAAVAAAYAEVTLAQGDLAGAADHARDALTQVAPGDRATAGPAQVTLKAWGVAAGHALGTLVVAYARLGRVDDTAALLAQPLPDGMLTTRYGLHYLYARGQHHLATRHHHAALADFLTCGELVRTWGLDAAEVVPWRSGAAEAWLRLGNQDQARRLVSGQLHRPTGNGPRTRGVCLRLLAAAGPAGRRPPLLLESLDLLEQCGDRFEQARTLADLAGAYHAVNEDRRARMVFRRALHLARACDADPLHRELVAVGSELGAGGADDGDADGAARLTGSEHRVAALAAIGYTNREIALKLYITASTVEQHLTRVYRKLNVKHRRELPIDLSRRSAPVG